MKSQVALACTVKHGFYFCSKCQGAGWIDDRGWPCHGQPFFSCDECPSCHAAYETLIITPDEHSRGYYLQGTFETYAWAETESALDAVSFDVVAQNKMRHPDGPDWPAVGDIKET